MTDAQMVDAVAATIDAARSAEQELFGGLDVAVLERPIRPDDWNPKDFQAHLTAWKNRQADRFAREREGLPPLPGIEDEEEDAINAQLRLARAHWDWPAIVAEADAVAARLVDEVRRADPEALRTSDRLISGTFGNGVLHTLTHVRWLVEAGVPLDRARVAAFTDQALRILNAPAIPEKARAVGIYDLACHHALSGAGEVARGLLREAFRLDPDLIEFSRTDRELDGIRDHLDDLAG